MKRTKDRAETARASKQEKKERKQATSYENSNELVLSSV